MVNIVALSGRPKDKLIQFALDSGKVKQEKLKWPMLWSEKFDGVFCLALKHDNWVYIFSRTGEPYVSMGHIQEALDQVMEQGEIVIFEAYTPGVVQATISGQCRDTKEQHTDLLALCHDTLTIDEFINGGGRPYIERQAHLFAIFERRGSHINSYPLRLVEQLWAKSMNDALWLTGGAWERRGEGGVLRNPLATYQGGKRNQDIIKLKKGVSYDLEVLYVQEGKGKYTNTVGTLVCKWKNGKTIEISGMTDEQRHKWWNGTEIIVGKIVQVDAMCESSKGLLREPRFKGIREDKTKGDF